MLSIQHRMPQPHQEYLLQMRLLLLSLIIWEELHMLQPEEPDTIRHLRVEEESQLELLSMARELGEVQHKGYLK